MKSKKSRGKGKQAGKRGIKDLPVSDARAKDAKGGGFSMGGVFKSIGKIGGGGGAAGSSYTQDQMTQDLK
jgi:hypothetical protein